jgi:FAD:protein FMN transferase
VTTLAAGTDTFSVFGTTASLLVSEPGRLDDARAVADGELAAVDLACSRFRPDSELSRLNGCGGAVTGISELFAELLEAALRAARLTDGDVDPTCGDALAEIGYDRDFTVLQAAGLQAPGAASPLSRLSRRVPGWRSVRLDRRRLLAQLTNGAQLDLGATAKAWAADRCAGIIAAKTGSGVLVSLGGDIAVAGPAPADGWRVRVTDDHAAGPDAPGQTVTIRSGGLATSSTTVRTWAVGGQRVHHIINPATGQPAVSCWRTVSVAAGSCVDANTASTAAIIRSEAALPWLQSAGLPARLVREDGSVETTAGWPSDPDPA